MYKIYAGSDVIARRDLLVSGRFLPPNTSAIAEPKKYNHVVCQAKTDAPGAVRSPTDPIPPRSNYALGYLFSRTLSGSVRSRE